jgi:rare lipoprotein A
MKRISLFLFTLYLGAICVQQHTAAQSAPVPGGEYFRQEGIASWYGYEFDGRPTASGEIYNSSLLTAAHPTLPFGTYLLVTNRQNNRQVMVKVNDRGPFVASRIIDLSRAAAEQLDMLITGTAPVVIDKIQASQAFAPPNTPPQAFQQPGYVYIQQTPVYPQQRLPTAPPSQQIPAPAQVPTQAPLPIQYPVPIQAPLPIPYPVPAQAPLPLPYPVQAQMPLPLPTIVPTPPPAPPEPQPPAPPAPSSINVTVYPPPSAAPQAPNPMDIPVGPRARLSPSINPLPNKIYKLQVGSYKIAGNAVDAYVKLKAAGLSPSYERKDDYFRVVLAGICGTDVISVTEKLGMAGFREAVIREER